MTKNREPSAGQSNGKEGWGGVVVQVEVVVVVVVVVQILAQWTRYDYDVIICRVDW